MRLYLIPLSNLQQGMPILATQKTFNAAHPLGGCFMVAEPSFLMDHNFAAPYVADAVKCWVLSATPPISWMYLLRTRTPSQYVMLLKYGTDPF